MNAVRSSQSERQYADLRPCIDSCNHCHDICLHAAMTQCLERGGDHAEPAHLRLMLDCAEICRTAADFMLSGSRFHAKTCAVCAEVCKACEESCEALDGMEECANICRECHERCRAMAGNA